MSVYVLYEDIQCGVYLLIDIYIYIYIYIYIGFLLVCLCVCATQGLSLGFKASKPYVRNCIGLCGGCGHVLF